VGKVLDEIVQSVSKTTDLVGEIAAASQEQAQGIDQVNTAAAQMDKVTQQNAANAEESASASEELSSQAESMHQIVNELAALVGGARRSNNGPAARKVSPHAASREVHDALRQMKKTSTFSSSDHVFHRIANKMEDSVGSVEGAFHAGHDGLNEFNS
jgi:methyl-accepting chemotaxis protein